MLKHNKRANGKVDAVVMSDGIADRIARLILNIKRSNQNTKILVIAGEDSDKNKDIRLWYRGVCFKANEQ